MNKKTIADYEAEIVSLAKERAIFASKRVHLFKRASSIKNDAMTTENQIAKKVDEKKQLTSTLDKDIKILQKRRREERSSIRSINRIIRDMLEEMKVVDTKIEYRKKRIKILQGEKTKKTVKFIKTQKLETEPDERKLASSIDSLGSLVVDEEELDN